MLRRVWIPSPNKSGRTGSGVRLVVVHTAEGARSFRDLGAFFARSATQASSHVGIDNEVGVIGEFVNRTDSSWAVAAYNSQSVNAELCGAPIASQQPCGASWSAEEWNRHDVMLANLASWIREECLHFGLPIVKLSAGEARGSGKGVCGHVDLGVSGGGHHDPGPGFPWARVMAQAQGQEPKVKPKPSRQTQSTAVLKHDGRLEVFEELPSGEVVHKWQERTDDGWAKAWRSLGKP